MGAIKFPYPANVDRAIHLINASRQWNLSIDEYDGAVDVVFGDQAMFLAETQEEVTAFLAGFFLATFSGQDLFSIEQELSNEEL